MEGDQMKIQYMQGKIFYSKRDLIRNFSQCQDKQNLQFLRFFYKWNPRWHLYALDRQLKNIIFLSIYGRKDESK